MAELPSKLDLLSNQLRPKFLKLKQMLHAESVQTAFALTSLYEDSLSASHDLTSDAELQSSILSLRHENYFMLVLRFYHAMEYAVGGAFGSTTLSARGDSEGLVLKALRGAVALNPDLRLHAPSKSVYAKTRSNAQVALISGGGAGHEPAHAGYTGRGMLAASVSGDIFASPGASQVLTCIRLALAVQGTTRVLLIVNNYTGDRLNFGLAAECAHSLSLQSESVGGEVEVETVVVADDVSLVDRSSLVGARGLAGNILVCKILGAAAEAGFSLKRLKKLGDAVVASLASIGVGLAHCHVPGRKNALDGDSAALIEDGMCELGLGLHNEPGVRRMEVDGVEKLVGVMLEQILSSTGRKAKVQSSSEAESKRFVRFHEDTEGADEVVLYVNNLGGMSTLEMSAIVDESISRLASQNIHPARVLLSSYMTSLNAPGFSLSLLNLSAICRNIDSYENSTDSVTITELLSFIDFPTEATAWAGVRSNWPASGNLRDRASEDEEANRLLSTFSPRSSQHPSSSTEVKENSRSSGWASLGIDTEHVKSGIRRACTEVLAVENELTRFDTIVGDGDCGETFSSGARTVLRALDEDELDVDKLPPSELVAALSELLLNSMGGTSGALFGLYFTALSNALSFVSNLSPSGTASSSVLSSQPSLETAPLAALHTLSTHTPARAGDRTLVDALSPFCTSLASGEGLDAAVRRAREGAESTRGMQARLGRATYVGGMDADDPSDPGLPPDPGAWGVAALLEGLIQGLGVKEEH